METESNCVQENSFKRAEDLKLRWTTHSVDRIEKTWSEYAGEPIKLHHDTIGLVVGVDAILAFGSELACLRLHYRLGCVGLVAKSVDGRWYYRSKK